MTLDEDYDPFHQLDHRKEDPMTTIVHPISPDEYEGVQVRQGDVLLIPVDVLPADVLPVDVLPADVLPVGVKPIKRDGGRVVLAYGQVTGHAHAIRSSNYRPMIES
jgi:hypothetical protein